MIKYIKWIIGFGFLVWLIPFSASFPIIELRESNRALFESIMPVVLTLTVLLFSILFFKKVDKEYFKEGIIVGFIWFILSIMINLIMFLPGNSPMHMDFISYMMDIGLTYLIILSIPVCIGFLLENKY
jgi:hypothetical protein